MEHKIIHSAAYYQLNWIVNTYKLALPIETFPYIMLSTAAIFQVLAWFGGVLFPDLTLMPRVFTLWMFALFQFIIMSPTINACKEILGYDESFLVILNHAVALCMFVIINHFLFKSPFKLKHFVAFVVLISISWMVHSN